MSEVFETDDLKLAEQALSRAYSSVRLDTAETRGGIRMAHAMVGSVRFEHDVFQISADVRGEPLGALVFGHLLSGRVSYESDGSERRFRPGDTFLAAQPEHAWESRIQQTDLELAILPPDLPSQIAATDPGHSPRPVRFTGYEPVSPDAARQWRATYAYIRDNVLADPEAAAQPLVAAGAARLLVAVTLTTFPNNSLADPAIADRRDAHPATLRRAIAYIDEHADLDIAVADIAAAAAVSTRAIQLAFRLHLDTTPTEFLRRIRLDRARRDLLAADPAHVTVTDIAYRWGFASASRFSAYYRQEYGIVPSRTLRKD
jgi:AraC-like DNA-binding protein